MTFTKRGGECSDWAVLRNASYESIGFSQKFEFVNVTLNARGARSSQVSASSAVSRTLLANVVT